MKNSTLQAADHGGHCAGAGSEAKPCRLLEVEVAQLVGQEEHWAWELWKHRWAWLCKKYCTEAQQYSRKILHRSTTIFRNIFSIRLFLDLDSSEVYYDRLLFRTIMNTNTSLTIKQLCVQEKCPVNVIIGCHVYWHPFSFTRSLLFMIMIKLGDTRTSIPFPGGGCTSCNLIVGHWTDEQLHGKYDHDDEEGDIDFDIKGIGNVSPLIILRKCF